VSARRSALQPPTTCEAAAPFAGAVSIESSARDIDVDDDSALLVTLRRLSDDSANRVKRAGVRAADAVEGARQCGTGHGR
jgi:hypothetical protein